MSARQEGHILKAEAGLLPREPSMIALTIETVPILKCCIRESSLGSAQTVLGSTGSNFNRPFHPFTLEFLLSSPPLRIEWASLR
jgi:hypothetical protein